MTSKIEWTDATWNPIVGCAKVSAGCKNCYAESQAARVVRIQRGGPYMQVIDAESGRRWNGNAVFLPERLGAPLHWRRPRRVFVNSMSDLFHEGVTFDEIAAICGVMATTPTHTYQVLTKRPERMLEFFAWMDGWKSLDGRRCPRAGVCLSIAHDMGAAVFVDVLSDRWPLPNVWLGVSVEDQAAADKRIPLLLKCPAALRFLSVEPLLGPVDLTAALSVVDRHGEPSGPRCNADGSPAIGWVIVGGESGPGARPCHVAWVREIVGQCKEAGVPVFVKQLGAAASDPVNGLASWRLRDRKGGDMSEWPEDLRVREMPEVGRPT